MQQRNLNCYQCEGEECNISRNHSVLVCEDAIMCWKSTSLEENGKVTSSRGCISISDQVPFYCNTHLHSSNRFKGFRIQCCQENLCNSGPFPILQNPTTEKDLTNTIKLMILMLGPIVGLFLLICGMYVYHRMNKSKNGSTSEVQNKNFLELGVQSAIPAISGSTSTSGGNVSCSHEIRATACGDSTIKEYMHGHSLTSGSGSGLPMLVQRTLAQQVTLAESLSIGGGNGGKFGRQIWRGVWHGESVAVKIYFSRDEAMWARETEVYSHLLPSRHDNILGYIGSDMTSQASCTQLWLVAQYHKPGSLHNYLKQMSQPLNHYQLLDICMSIVNGLLYLHTEIQGTQGKPAMAHRNLSSKTIVVKTNGSCAIADLAHVVTQDGLATDKMDFKQICKRYISPELLDKTIDAQSLESFRLADMYSLGLVLWEVCRCCISNGTSLNYTAPYSEWLVNSNQEPTLDEMKKLVITDQRRPPIPNQWSSDPILSEMGQLMEECWYTKASSRLPILRVKKSLSKIVENNSDVDLSLD